MGDSAGRQFDKIYKWLLIQKSGSCVVATLRTRRESEITWETESGMVSISENSRHKKDTGQWDREAGARKELNSMRTSQVLCNTSKGYIKMSQQ